MEKINKDAYWLAFSSIEEIGASFIRKVYEHFGCIKSAWCAGPDNLYRIEDITKKQMDVFLRARAGVNPEECLEFIKNRGIKYINFDDESYPALLKEIHNPPMTLFYKGDFSRCNLERTLAVVGSRRASEGAKNTLSKIISEFAGTDVCIVSGLAAGIDTCAHKSAIENGLSTIAVIGSGFDFVYPTSNKNLYEKIIDGNGAIVTEYYPTFEPLKFRFPQRNRIVSGLSYGTLVVEAAIKSGALITANITLDQGRELMCIPGLITNPNTEGIYKLLKTGAAMVTESDDVLNALGWEIINENKNFDESDDLTIDEKKILYTINIEPKNFDEIQNETKLSTDDLLVLLTTLELKCKLKQVVGDRYSKI